MIARNEDRMEPLVEQAIARARAAHAGQFDKGERPYIDHPLRVMERVRPHGRDAMIAAVLHDVVEDGA
jgi:(p)ppGpp synthase/HD superfamily hydrolase